MPSDPAPPGQTSNSSAGLFGPLARPPALPRGTVPGLSAPSLSAPSQGGSIAHLFPVVTPAPPVPRAGLAQHGPSAAGSGTAITLTAETGVTDTGPGRVIVLAVTIAAGLAAAGTWLTLAGPGRRAVISLARRGGRRVR